MKEIPMLFSTAMVQAILAGHKTETRRIMKPQPSDNWMENVKSICPSMQMYRSNGEQMFWLSDPAPDSTKEIKCPYGKPGDVIWVRETFKYTQPYGPESLCYFYKDGTHGADVSNDITYLINDYNKWRPSIHMPKEACRLKLAVKEIRAERLQDISEEDAIAEGILPQKWYDEVRDEYIQLYENYGKVGYMALPPVDSFSTLWVSIYGLDSWKANPWVWVVKFEIIEK